MTTTQTRFSEREDAAQAAYSPLPERGEVVRWSWEAAGGFTGAAPERREVAWSSIGRVTPEEARAFAQAILQACDDVEAYATSKA
jgi:hypothetical protein